MLTPGRSPGTMKQNWISWIILGLISEKIFQHSFTAFLFSVDIEGIGIPDAGQRIVLGNPIMSALNLGLAVLFVWGFWDVWRKSNNTRRGLYLIIVLCLFDIVAEFLFHGLVLVTVSVLVALVLIYLAILQLRIERAARIMRISAAKRAHY